VDELLADELWADAEPVLVTAVPSAADELWADAEPVPVTAVLSAVDELSSPVIVPGPALDAVSPSSRASTLKVAPPVVSSETFRPGS